MNHSMMLYFHMCPISVCDMIFSPFRAAALAALQNHSAISATYSTFNTGMSLFFLSTFLIFSPSADPHIVLLSQLGGLIGVAPDRKQLTAVQEVYNKGHNEPQARRQERERDNVCVCVCVSCVCKYVDYCFQWCQNGAKVKPSGCTVSLLVYLLYFSKTISQMEYL